MRTRFLTHLRVMFILWMAGVTVLGLLAVRDPALDGKSRSLFTFLLQRHEPASAPMALTPMPQPAPPPVAPVAPEAPVAPVVATTPEVAPPLPTLPELPKGKRNGKGTLGKPVITTQTPEELIITIPYTGTLGDCTAHTPHNMISRSMDFHGAWRSSLPPRTPLNAGPVRLVQAADHPGFVRVSAIAAAGVKGVQERIEYSATEIIIHLTPRTTP